MRFEDMRATMIDSQLRPTGVNDPRVLAAFAGVPRERFVPPRLQRLAYLDEDLEISPGRFLMEPVVFGNLVMRSDLQPADRVLLIGAGMGYEAAVIARITDHVTAVEEDAALAADAASALADSFTWNVKIVSGPLAAGAPDGAPYDVLMLNGAVELVPDSLVQQLADGGRIAGVIIDQGIGRAVAGRKSAGRIGTSAFMDAAVGRLPGFARPHAFRF